MPAAAARFCASLATAVALSVNLSVAAAQTPEPIRFARNAGIANDGRVAFTYQDDIWVVDADGSNPHRLTVNVARDFSPRFSPDGKWIAFTSARTGNNDVFIVPSTEVSRSSSPGSPVTTRRCTGRPTAKAS